jgi:PAS domain S-box-containing protein
LSSSTGEAPRLAARSQLSGEGLAELLSVISEAPDFGTAATFLVAQLADVAGSRRAVLLTLDRSNQMVQVAATVGFPPDAQPTVAIPLDDQVHPLVVSLLSLTTIFCEGANAQSPRLGLPFKRWTVIPFPQPQYRGSPPLISERRAAELAITGCAVHALNPDRRRRIGHAPCGVVVVENVPDPELTSALSHAAMLAGPVLARMFAVEEYRRAAERLDSQRDLLTAILNSLPDPIVITDAANDIVVHNRRAEHLLAIKESDSEGRRRAVEINNLLFTSFLSKSVMAGGVDGGARELNLVDPDEGTDLLFEVLAHPLSADISREGSFVSVLRDVTDLRRAAGELERQIQRVRLAEIDATRERDRLNLILANVADPILVTDVQSNIILMNRQAEELFEAGADAASRSRLGAVRGNDTRFTTFISDFTISPASARREQMTFTQPDSGLDFPVEVVSGKIFNQRGEAMAIVSVVHDLTKQVENERLYEELKTFSSQLEARITAATADLAEQNQRLQWQSRELEKANRLKSEFLASMSHELRTPINALIGYTSLMLDRIYGEITAKQEEGLHRIQASAQHLLALINDILDLAKIEAGKMPLHLEDVPVASIIAEITQQIEPLVRKKALDFTTEIPPDAPVMHTDRTKVKQILLNLLSNAVKFTHAGRVVLRVVPASDEVRLDIADTGIGIRQHDLHAIWEDFRQVDQSRTREFGGTGLGLSITRKLVEALGGRIAVESEYGAGSTFSVILPLRTQPPDDRGPRALGDGRTPTPRSTPTIV